MNVRQCVINESMPLLAHTTNLLNSDDNLISPWLTKIVHYRVNHKLYSAYGKLADGLHFKYETKVTVAKRFVESFRKNIEL